MRKKIIIGAAIAIIIIVYMLFIRTDYTGSFNFSLDGNEYNWSLKQAERHHVDDGTIFRTVYSEGRNSIEIVFKIWEEDGETYIRLDNPTIQLDGERHRMTRPIRNSDYSIDALLSNYIGITFWGMPFDDGIHLNGIFTLQGINTDLF